NIPPTEVGWAGSLPGSLGGPKRNFPKYPRFSRDLRVQVAPGHERNLAHDRGFTPARTHPNRRSSRGSAGLSVTSLGPPLVSFAHRHCLHIPARSWIWHFRPKPARRRRHRLAYSQRGPHSGHAFRAPRRLLLLHTGWPALVRLGMV